MNRFVEERDVEDNIDDLLWPNGHEWEETDEIVRDIGTILPPTSIAWGDNGLRDLKTPLECVHVSFPMSKLVGYIETTNMYVNRKNYNLPYQSPVTEAEFFKWMAIRLVYTLDGSRNPIYNCWSVEQEINSCQLPGNYGERFNMSRNRF